MWHVEANIESKSSQLTVWSRCPCFAAINAHVPGKQRCLRLKPVFTIEKTKWFRWVTWGMLLYTVTGIWIHLMFHSYQLLGCVWFLTLSYIQGKFDLFLHLSLFSTTYIIVISTQITHVGPVCQTRNFPSLSLPLALSFSLSLFLFFTQTMFAPGSLYFRKFSSLPLNRTIIYLFMYNENECTLLISSWNKHSKRLH